MDRNTLKIILIFPAIFLIIAPLVKFPYGIYVLLRLVVFGSAACMIYFSYKNTKQLNITILTFSFIGLLFNPFFPIHLSREIWMPIDFIVSAIYFYSSYKLLKN
jgi:hypothetical protein